MTTTVATAATTASAPSSNDAPKTNTVVSINRSTGGRKRVRQNLSLASSTCAGLAGMDWMTQMLLPSSETDELVGTTMPAIIATASTPKHITISAGIMIMFITCSSLLR